MQNVIADERVVVICDQCGTEYPSASEYDPKRPAPQDIYVPEDFEVLEDGREICQRCNQKRVMEEQELLDSKVPSKK
jgi:DNA-directed RNA polymerase subunit RPC12/RpoP